MPMNVRNNRPLPTRMPNCLAPIVKRNPPQQNDRRDGRHRTVCLQITRLPHPRIRVETQQEPKHRLEPHHRQRDLPGHRPVRINHVHQADIGPLDNPEIQQAQPDGGTHPVQTALYPDAIQHQAQRRGEETGDHARQTHLGVPHALVPLRGPVGPLVAQVAARGDAQQRAQDGAEEAEADLPGLEVVGCFEGDFDVGRHGDEEADRGGLAEGRPEHGREADEAEGAEDELEEGFVGQGRAWEEGQG